ncbi:glycosyltransferase family 2 protein [Microbacterium sp. SD291]|uniref:glycosyltransferase family 2 protein n=1 Tax=Microbacterium sp. SD291 TaxID=2782007 RepID=UPI001A9792E1|nr:glycosyltransferase family 2 protein [Microbacterium sp. SD291]MBO0980978.1 glycosyltransferase family 2 protein [Microbacterium sp. SD291]
MDSLTFALVIPTYRRPHLVLQAVESGLRQDRPFDEIIVVADGEDDPALDVLREQPVVIEAVPHGGVASARNAGIARATTDWVCFLDDDDLLHPHYLSSLERDIEARPTVKAFNTEYWSFAEKAGPREEFEARDLDGCLAAAATAAPKNDMAYLHIEGRSFDRLLERLLGSMSTAAVEREVLQRAGGFPTGFATAEDWTMYVNVSRLTEWGVVPERLAFFRDHVANVTHTGSTSKGLTVLRAIGSFWGPTPLPTPPHRSLDDYRRFYRYELRNVLERCRRARDIVAYREALRLAAPILPRRIDRLSAMIPPAMWEGVRRIRRRRRGGDVS